jgi:peptide/nickel transport system permease protein
MTATPPDAAVAATGGSGSVPPPAENAGLDETAVPSRAGIVLRRFLRKKQGVFGLVVVVLLILLAFVGPYLSKWSYTSHDFESFLIGPNGSHWFGTDQTGGDVYAQTMRGAQKSIIIGLLVAVLATGLAAVVGAAAGYFGGWVDKVLTWLTNLLLVLPSFLIIAVLSSHFRGNDLLFIVLLGMFIWQITALIVRGQTLSLREREYVLAARYMGVPSWKIIFRHILPNLSSLLIIDATVNVSAAIITEASLSFFGFGVQPPDVSLGTLISDAQNAAAEYPWLFLFPAGFLVLLVLAVNLFGDGLRDALDPSSGQSQ